MGTDSTPADHVDLPPRHSKGPAIAAVPDPTPLRPAADRTPVRTDRGEGSDPAPGAWFAVVLRGYDRAQVDARLAELDRRIRDEIMRADAAEAAVTAARAHVRRLQDTVTPATDDHGFGLRVERVLNAAEREAEDVRNHAAQEAETVLEKAREDAERARRQTEEALLGRAAKLDDEFAARSAALDAREQKVDRMVEHARREADEIRAEAGRAAADSTSAAERSVADLRRAAEETIDRQRAEATHDIGRMATLRDEVRHELSRLQEMLRGELDADRPPAAHVGGSGVSGFDDTDTEATGIASSVDSRDDVGDDANVRTAIGAIPPYTVASIGVLPFGDRSAGGPASGRSFSFELVPDMWSDGDDHGPTHGPVLPRTSDDTPDDGSAATRNPTRSTLPTQGRR